MNSKFLILITGFNALMVLTAWTRQSTGSSPDVVRAQRLDLVDRQGRVKGQLYLGEDGSGQLRLRNAKGEVAVKLGALESGGSSLLLLDPTVEPGIILSAGAEGSDIRASRNGALQSVVP
jgi:hypothetical protein